MFPHPLLIISLYWCCSTNLILYRISITIRTHMFFSHLSVHTNAVATPHTTFITSPLTLPTPHNLYQPCLPESFSTHYTKLFPLQVREFPAHTKHNTSHSLPHSNFCTYHKNFLSASSRPSLSPDVSNFLLFRYGQY
jgi:hypothetical protein